MSSDMLMGEGILMDQLYLHLQCCSKVSLKWLLTTTHFRMEGIVNSKG